MEDTSEIRICQILYILPDIYMPFTHCLLQKKKKKKTTTFFWELQNTDKRI